jgi:hypothetical protein
MAFCETRPSAVGVLTRVASDNRMKRSKWVGAGQARLQQSLDF